MICSRIPTPEKQATPIIPLKNDYNHRKDTNIFIFKFIKERTSGMEKLSSLTSLQSKEKPISTSSIGVESSQVSIERDHFSNVIYKLTPE